MHRRFLEYLICPACGEDAPLCADDAGDDRGDDGHDIVTGELRCERCGAAYPVRDIVWCQEEPWNMGAWSYVQERMRRVLGPEVGLRYVGRHEAASPAAGSYSIHEQEEAEFVREAFAQRSRERS